eukprot:1789603-Karenia_brevis.AAC.1
MAPEGDVVPMTGFEVNVARAKGVVEDPARFYAAVGQATVSPEEAPQGTGPGEGAPESVLRRIPTTPTDERIAYDVHGNFIAPP